MRNESRMRQVGWFALVGCIVGLVLAYGTLVWLHLMVAPTPREVAGLAWAAPGIAFAGLAAFFWFGPGLLMRFCPSNKSK